MPLQIIKILHNRTEDASSILINVTPMVPFLLVFQYFDWG